MNYKVYDPAPALQSFVKCFCTFEDEGTEEPVKQRVVPEGCMEMIFHYFYKIILLFQFYKYSSRPRRSSHAGNLLQDAC